MFTNVNTFKNQRTGPRRILLPWLLLGIFVIISATATATNTPIAPTATYTDTHGQTVSTATLKGHASMVWLLSTWCRSCSAGLSSLNAHVDQLRASGLHVVILRTYQNGGVTGPDIASFVAQNAPALTKANVLLGEATQALERAYNPRHYPDIYYLIDANGQIQAVDTAPSITLNKILDFAKAHAGESRR